MSVGEAACPLCGSGDAGHRECAHGRRYLECPRCRLIFVEPEQRPDVAAERAHYATHRNDPDDAGYRAWLDRAAGPLAARLAPGAEGLDYGCGPGPALARMLEERGFPTREYDPFFAPDAEALRRDYDWIACTETAEHFHRPGEEFARLDALLRPAGWLAVMTQWAADGVSLAGWRYARDPTHVCFYREETMRWIAERFGWSMEVPRRDVALFHKPVRPCATASGG